MNTKKITRLQELIAATDENLEFDIMVQVKKVYRAESGLNIFTVSDGGQEMQFIAFSKDAGKYSDIKAGHFAFFTVKQKRYDGKLQGDVQFARAAEASKDLKEKFAKQAASKYLPKKVDLLYSFAAFEKLKESMLAAATEIRKAIFERRPILITHHGDCDGYAAGVLLERAIVNQIQQHNSETRYLQNYIQRNPSKTPYYNLADVTKDIAIFQLNMERAGTIAPLILVVDNGSTEQDVLAMQKAKLFGADVIVIDHHDPGAKDESGKTLVCKETLAHVNPHLVGVDKNLSASMLCLQVAAYIDELGEPSIQLAAVGGVADKCAGDAITQLITDSGRTKEYLENLAKCVDYEIYYTKFNNSTGALYDLLDGEQQEQLMQLYQPLMKKEREAIIKSVNKYATVQTVGAYNVAQLDGEATTLWGDYYSIGKLAAILHDQHEDKENHITLVYSDSIIVFRVRQTSMHHFDVNELLAQLTNEIDYARIDGGGHDVAGSIRFLSAARDEILDFITTYIQQK